MAEPITPMGALALDSPIGFARGRNGYHTQNWLAALNHGDDHSELKATLDEFPGAVYRINQLESPPLPAFSPGDFRGLL